MPYLWFWEIVHHKNDRWKHAVADVHHKGVDKTRALLELGFLLFLMKTTLMLYFFSDRKKVHLVHSYLYDEALSTDMMVLLKTTSNNRTRTFNFQIVLIVQVWPFRQLLGNPRVSMPRKGAMTRFVSYSEPTDKRWMQLQADLCVEQCSEDV